MIVSAERVSFRAYWRPPHAGASACLSIEVAPGVWRHLEAPGEASAERLYTGLTPDRLAIPLYLGPYRHPAGLDRWVKAMLPYLAASGTGVALAMWGGMQVAQGSYVQGFLCVLVAVAVFNFGQMYCPPGWRWMARRNGWEPSGPTGPRAFMRRILARIRYAWDYSPRSPRAWLRSLLFCRRGHTVKMDSHGICVRCGKRVRGS